MLNWLVRLWNRLRAWMEQRPTAPTHHTTIPEDYHPSNLHARRY